MRRLLGVTVLVLFAILPAAARADDPSLALRWHLDSLGATTPDSAPGGAHAGTVSGVTAVDGRFGGGATFTGGGSIRTSRTGLDTPQVTLSAWVRSPTSPAPGTRQRIAGLGGAEVCDETAYALEVAANGSVSFNGSPAAEGFRVWDGFWHHVAGVYDGGKLRLYLDGIEVGTGTAAGPINYNGSPGGFSAGRYVADSCSDTQAYGGELDEVRVYGRALGPAELAYLGDPDQGGAPGVLPVPAPPESVALQHHLDTQSGGTTPDSSGNGLGGVDLVGTSVAGRFGQALQTGGGGYRILDDPRLQPQRFTAMAWVNSSATPVFQTIFGKGGATNGAGPHSCAASSWALRTQGNGDVGFFVNLLTAGGGNTFVTPTVIPRAQALNGQWHAVAGTYEDGVANLYLDGQLFSTANVPAPEEIDYGTYPETRAAVGRYPANGCTIGTFPGAIDEVRLYDRVLSGAEIQAIQDPAATSPPASPAATPTPLPAPQNGAGSPQLWWKLDSFNGNPEGAASTPDASGHNNTGTATVFDPLQTGRFGPAMRLPTRFQGLGSGIRQPTSAFLESPRLTALLWVRHRGAPTDGRILSNANDCSGGGWRLQTTGGAVSFTAVAQGGTVTTPASDPAGGLWDGAWHQLAVTYRPAEARIFVDGQSVASTAGAGPLAYPSGNHNGFTVGSSQGSSCDNAHPEIDVDDARLYTGVLSPSQLQYLSSPFQLSSPSLPIQPLTDDNLVTRLHLDARTDGDAVADSSGHGHHGVDVKGADVSDGRFGHALGFSAPGDGFLVPGAGREDPFTALAWVRRSGAAAPGSTLLSGNGGCSPGGWTVGGGQNGGLQFGAFVLNGETLTVVATDEVPPAQVFNGQWHAVAVTFAAGVATLWIDGAIASRKTGAGSQILYAQRTGLGVGRAADGCASHEFAGDVDEVRVYDRALTDEEIAYLQAPGFTTPPDLPVGPIPTPTATPIGTPTATVTPDPTVTGTPTPTPTAEPEPDLALKWHLNRREEAAGAPYDGKVYDASGGGHHGTVDLGAFSGPGRFGNALELPTDPPSNTVGVRTTGAEDLQPQKLTLMTWIRATNPGQAAVVAAYGTSDCGGEAFNLQENRGDLAMSVNVGGEFGLVPGPRMSGLFDGQWHAVAGTYDGVRLRAYVDGVQVGNGTGFGGDVDPIPYAANSSLRVGAPVHNNPGCGTPFKGSIDETRLYSRALSDAEIAYLQAGYHRTPPSLPIPDGPKNIERPTLSGLPKVGEVMSCNAGAWTGNPDRYEYLWERAPRATKVDGDDAWVAIESASGPSYTVRDTDDGGRIRCREIAFAGLLSGEAVSRSIRTDKDIPVSTAPPTVNVVDTAQPVRSGFPLKCDPGAWTTGPEPADFTYRWDRDGVAIPGATDQTYTPVASRANASGDGNHDLRCAVSARNDVGQAGFVTSAARFVIDDKPLAAVPHTSLTAADDGSANPLRKTAVCDKGTWVDAYADHPATADPGYDYRYQWYRRNRGQGLAEAIPIAGATSREYKITADVLGRSLNCKVTTSNPLGETTSDFSFGELFVDLPVAVKHGTIDFVYRQNESDPVNMTAVDDEYRQLSLGYAQEQFEQERTGQRESCRQGQARILAEIAKLPKTRQTATAETPLQRLQRLVVPDRVPKASELALNLNDTERCWILLRDDAHVSVTAQGVVWSASALCVPLRGPSSTGCRDLGIRLQPVDGATAASVTDSLFAAQVGNTTPVRVLWDLNGDKATDVSCPGSSPVVRAQLVEGEYPITATIVQKDSETTGIFSSASNTLDFPTSRLKNPGFLRPNLPKWCRTSMVPPPDPEVGPCASAATIGAVQLKGNLCPINVRAIPDSETKGLPDQMQKIIKTAAAVINAQEFEHEKLLPGYDPGTRSASLLAPPFRSAETSAVAAGLVNTAATVGNLDLATTYAQSAGAPLDQALDAAFAQTSLLDPKKGSFALDQIYAVNAVGSPGANGFGGQVGALQVNGVTIQPTGNLHTIIAPSDVGQGIKGLLTPEMEIFSPEAASVLGGIPLSGSRDVYEAKLVEAVNQQKDKYLKEGIDYTLDKFKSLADKLDLGPFKLTGTKVDVKLNNDGTATLEAVAELPGITSAYPDPRSPGAKAGDPIKVGVKLSGDLNGNIKLEDISLNVPKAYLIGLQLEGLKLQYNRQKGLDVSGLITFPLSGGQGIKLEDFRLGPNGEFLGTNVAYFAGIGQGVQFAPGVFLTKIGGGFHTKPYEIDGQAAVSAGPSAGNGCPQVGVDGKVDFHWSPTPLFVKVVGDVGLVCIPLVNFDFYADDTGWIKASAHVDKDFKLVHVFADINGELKTNDVRLDASGKIVSNHKLPWQIDMNGKADFNDLPIPKIQLKGVLSNLGVAACGRVRFNPPDPFPGFTVAAGAGIKFIDGVPPLTPPQLIAGFRAFTGCDLGAFTPLRALRVSRQADAPQVFTLDKGRQALSFEGAGAAPQVRLTAPDGEVYDFTDATHGKLLPKAFGAIVEEENRTVVILPYAQAGSWRAEVAEGSTPIVSVQRAAVLPQPRVKARVTGKGAKRVLAYDVKRIPGQRVAFVETATSGHKLLGSVNEGGKGKLHYRLGETRSPKRTIEALVVQDDRPRVRIEVAHYVAANPKLRAPRVRIRRAGGGKAIVTWRKASAAQRYDVVASFSDGRRLLLEPTSAKLAITVPGVGAKGGLAVRVTGFTAGNRRTPTGTARLKQVKPKKHGHKKHKRKKGKRKKK